MPAERAGHASAAEPAGAGTGDAGHSQGHDMLLRELGRINSELAAHRRLCAEVVHDLANPAQVVLGLSELLMEHPTLDPGVRQRLGQVHRSAMTMSSLIADLAQGLGLDDHAGLALERVELAELVGSVVERSRLLGEAKAIRLDLELQAEEAEPCLVDADTSKLERALGNLIGNAIKFSPRGSVVTVGLTWDDRHARIAVADEGPGITPQGQDLIFEVFHREEGTAHLPGLGLGLFITRQIAEGHGGRVTVDSDPGRGATFVLEVPLAYGEALADLA